MLKSGGYAIGFDMSNNKDIPVLTVGKYVDNKMTVINVFIGDEAIDMYKKLIGPEESKLYFVEEQK
jgi:hypothetical protein